MENEVKEASATTAQLIGAGVFGAVIGWVLYYINRYRKDVVIGDLATIAGAIGAGTVLTLFPAKTDLFAAYAIGLGIGFFGYFALLLLFVWRSKEITVSAFLGVPVPGATESGRLMRDPRGLNE